MSPRKKIISKCLVCGKETPRPTYIYCSNMCQRDREYKSYILKWKAGQVTGLQGLGIVSSYIKKYLRMKYEDRCCLCGWSEVNAQTNRAPLVADHIDGNWRNNKESNLRLICPNCDSLLPTYAGLNRGRGRGNRVLSKRAKECRMFLLASKPK